MGVKTLYEYFYKLAYGDKGADKATLVNDCLDIADAEIKANKDAKHTQGTDDDLDATFEALFVKKADTVNVLSDITSPGADIEDAVTKKHANTLDHSQNTDTDLDATFEATFVKTADVIAIAKGGTGQITAQTAINALSAVAGATNEHVLTKDTATGNAIYKASAGGAGVPTGSIIAYGAVSAPNDWLLCNGTAVSRTTYAGLFAIIGTTYGVGDGSTTFNVPNLKGKVPVGLDATQGEFDALAEIGGAKTHALITAEMPAHVHAISGGSDATSDKYPRQVSSSTVRTSNSNSSGGGGAHNNLQPYLVVNYIIKT